MAALLHDIGQVSVPPKLLVKPTARLTTAERKLLQRHPVTGHSMLKGIPGFEEISLMVRHHHEAFSGDGYPDGLSGESIPLGARVIAVANVFDRLVHPSGRGTLGAQMRALR